jgi:hypothetical protein
VRDNADAVLKTHRCDCGTEQQVEHTNYYNRRWSCPRCGTIHTHLLLRPGESLKVTDTFENAVRLLELGFAEDAAMGFARAYVLWLKHIISGKDAEWFGRKQNRRANVDRLVTGIKELLGIEDFTLLQKNYRNELEHDPKRLTTRAEATAYAEHVLQTMETNLAELMGEEVWRRGQAGELDSFTGSDADEHQMACITYWHHWRHGNIGYVKTMRAWWSAHQAGRRDWTEALWV